LKNSGVPLPDGILTIEELTEALVKVKNANGCAFVAD
jgi:hypothetical protein